MALFLTRQVEVRKGDDPDNYFHTVAQKFGVPIGEVWDVYDVFKGLDTDACGRVGLVGFRELVQAVSSFGEYVSTPRAYALLNMVATES